jgi:mannose-6-phosphate isomerase-like protein (cupin superfamily)
MEIVNYNRVKPFMTKDTSEIREILAPGNSSIRNQSLAEAKLAPRKATEEHYHIRTEEIYYILRGKGRILIESESRDINAGDGIAILPGKKHKIENSGTRDMVFLCCCAPAYSHEDTILI